MTEIGSEEWRRKAVQARSHPYLKVHASWLSLDLVWKLHRYSRSELQTLLNAMEGDIRVGIKAIGNMPEGERDRAAIRFEMVRLLVNYLSSVTTLIEHTRPFMSRYIDTEFAAEYERRKQVIVENGLGGFLKELRNIALHQQIPPWTMTLDLPAAGTSATHGVKVLLDRETLRGLYKWTARPRAFLLSQEPQFAMIDVIDDYATQIDDLYNWILDQFKNLDVAQRAEYNALVLAVQGEAITPGHPNYVPWDQRERRNPSPAVTVPGAQDR